MARRLQGRPEARRHDHGRREVEHSRHAEHAGRRRNSADAACAVQICSDSSIRHSVPAHREPMRAHPFRLLRGSQPHVTPWRASTWRTASTSSPSSTANCASACFFRYSSRSLIAVSVGAQDQVLDLHFAFRLLVAALDDDAGAVALVGIFHLLADIVLRIAEIQLGADVRRCAASPPSSGSRRCGRGRTP